MENSRGSGEGEGEVVINSSSDRDHHVVVIEPTELNSRIRMSASLQKQHDAEAGNDDMEEEGGEDQQQQPVFPRLSAVQAANGRGRVEYRRVRCPPHRYTPLREHWEQILTPLVEYLKLQVRIQ